MTPHTSARRAAPPKGAATSQAIDGAQSRRGASYYTLPSGLVQISFSGGRTSAYMLHQIMEANGGLRDGVEVVFTNTGREFPETLDFVAEVGQRWGVAITWVEYRRSIPGFTVVGRQGASENGEPFDALIDAKQYLPNVTQRFCTQELKIRPAAKYLKAKGWQHWTSCIGIRADEMHRLPDPSKPRKERWTRWHPLADAGVTRRDVAEFWRAQAFDLCLPNIDGRTAKGNCDGCFLKAEKSRAMLARDFPERAAWWEAAEKRIGALENQKGRAKDASLFDKRGGWSQLRDFIGRQGDWIFDAEDALCQRDDGECTW